MQIHYHTFYIIIIDIKDLILYDINILNKSILPLLKIK